MIDSKGERFLSVSTLKKLVYNSSLRSKFIQGLAIFIAFSIGYYLFSNIVDNLRQMELPFGFGFISSTAGFDIGTHPCLTTASVLVMTGTAGTGNVASVSAAPQKRRDLNHLRARLDARPWNE